MKLLLIQHVYPKKKDQQIKKKFNSTNYIQKFHKISIRKKRNDYKLLNTY
jgi:hypothetical protein